MKKTIFILTLLLACAFLFAGCDNGVGYLKTAQTSLNLANFYNDNYYKNIQIFENVDEKIGVAEPSSSTESQTEPSEQEGQAPYKQMTPENVAEFDYQMSFIYSVLKEEKCLIASVDAYEVYRLKQEAAGKALGSNDSTPINALYEFENVLKGEYFASSSDEQSSYTSLVKVMGNAKNTSLTAQLYYIPSGQNYLVNNLTKENDYFNCEFVFTFKDSYNANKDVYNNITYKTNNKTARVTTVEYNKAKGCLKLDYLTYNSIGTAITVTKSIYKYSNGSVGIRSLSSFTISGVNTICEYEQLSKYFNSKLKLGYVANAQKLPDMEKMSEDAFSSRNDGSKSGQIFNKIYDMNTKDSGYTFSEFTANKK